jgi:hypothetical protein
VDTDRIQRRLGELEDDLARERAVAIIALGENVTRALRDLENVRQSAATDESLLGYITRRREAAESAYAQIVKLASEDLR